MKNYITGYEKNIIPEVRVDGYNELAMWRSGKVFQRMCRCARCVAVWENMRCRPYSEGFSYLPLDFAYPDFYFCNKTKQMAKGHLEREGFIWLI